MNLSISPYSSTVPSLQFQNFKALKTEFLLEFGTKTDLGAILEVTQYEAIYSL